MESTRHTTEMEAETLYLYRDSNGQTHIVDRSELVPAHATAVRTFTSSRHPAAEKHDLTGWAAHMVQRFQESRAAQALYELQPLLVRGHGQNMAPSAWATAVSGLVFVLLVLWRPLRRLALKCAVLVLALGAMVWGASLCGVPMLAEGKTWRQLATTLSSPVRAAQREAEHVQDASAKQEKILDAIDRDARQR